ncbi:MAG TPA: 50S ribosomal protein L22 [Patescibacteria group bacterium]|nr:50S ribosomal protein L22 [Patescibacteria group bacterium]
MEVKASLKHLRMSAQKVRLVLDVVRGLSVTEALDQLRFINKLAARPVEKLLKSAIANAENTFNLERSNLLISGLRADEGVTLKRWMPRAYGRATSIRKRACHINIVLKEIKESGASKKKEATIEEPVKLEQIAKDAEKTKKTKTEKGSKIEKEAGKKASVPDKAKMFRRKAG